MQIRPTWSRPGVRGGGFASLLDSERTHTKERHDDPDEACNECSSPRRCPSHRQEQLRGALTVKLTSAPPGRDAKGALIKTATALHHRIIASPLWLVFIAALPRRSEWASLSFGRSTWCLSHFVGSLDKEVVAMHEVITSVRNRRNFTIIRDGNLSVRHEGRKRWQSSFPQGPVHHRGPAYRLRPDHPGSGPRRRLQLARHAHR